MARVDGRPKRVSERYVGTAADIEAMLQARERQMLPDRSRHLGFGDLAAVWTMMRRLGVVEVIDEVVGARRADAGASVGAYLALAVLNRVVDPCSKRGFADWWASTAADRFTRIGSSVLDHRRFWDAMRAVSMTQLATCQQRLAAAMVTSFGLDISSLALDMTNFATYIDTANTRAPNVARGKAKQKRSDLRLVGLGLVVTRDGGVPQVWHDYPGNKPDVTQFATMIDLLAARHAAVAERAGQPEPPEMTVVFDAGQNSTDNFTHLAKVGLHYVGSVPPSDYPDLLALPASQRTIVDDDRFEGLTALESRARSYGTDRRTVLTHSPTLHKGQARGFEQTLTKATSRLQELAERLARGKTRRGRPAVEADIHQICHDSWVKRVLTWQLTGQHPAELRLSFHIDPSQRTTLEDELFGKRILIPWQTNDPR